MERPPQMTKEEMEQKYGGDSVEYPPEITDAQKELSEQLAKHTKWCEENGLDPKENEFYLAAPQGTTAYYTSSQDGEQHLSSYAYIGGTYKGKKIYIYPGEDRHKYDEYGKSRWPVIDIEGEEKLLGTPEVYKKATEIRGKLAPVVAYDRAKIIQSNRELEQHDKWVKGKSEREAFDNAHQKRKEKHEQGRQAVLNVLGIDPSLSAKEVAEKLKVMTTALKEVEFPKDKYNEYGYRIIDEIGEAEAAIEVLNKRREALLKAMGSSGNTTLEVTEKVFPSTNTHRRASQNWSIVGPREWDEYTVTQKMAEVKGEINGKKIVFEEKKIDLVGKQEDTGTNYESVAELATDLARYGAPFHGRGQEMQATVEDDGVLKEFKSTEVYMSAKGEHDPVYKERDSIFEVLLHLADYTKGLEKRIERMKRQQARAEEERKKRLEASEAAKAKEAEAIKKIGGLF